jgi:hypothetical protein
VRAIGIACILALLGACAGSDRVVPVFRSASIPSAPFETVMVVGAHENAQIRRQFEDSVVQALRAAGTGAVSSLNVMPSDDAIDRDAIVAAAASANADAVLVTRLLDSEVRSEIGGGRATAQAQRRGDLPLADFFRYDYVEYADPLSVATVRTVVLATDLYSSASETRVWGIESTQLDKATISEAIDGAAAAIVSALGRDRLIR